MFWDFFNGNSRGNAVVLFFVIVFAVAVISISLVDLNLSGQQQFEQEVEHSKTVENNLEQLHTDIVESTRGGSQATTVQVGFKNQVSASGTLQLKKYNSLSKSQYTIKNAQRAKKYKPYWNGTNHSYNAQYLSYSIDYSRYTDNPSFYISPSLSYYSEQPAPTKSQVTKKPQQLVQGDRINLVTFTGPLDVSSTTRETVEITPVSASTENIIIESENNSQPVNITIPSRLNETQWENALSEQMTSNGGYITEISTVESSSTQQNLIGVTFAVNETYELSLSKLHLSTKNKESQIQKQPPEYVDWSGNSQLSFQTSGRKEIDVKVRDRYNNPSPGTKVWGIANETARGTPKVQFYLNETEMNTACEGDFRSATSGTCTSSTNTIYSQPGIRNMDNTGEETFIYKPEPFSQTGQFIYASNPQVNQITTHNIEFNINGTVAGSQFSNLLIHYTQGDTSVEGVVGGGRDSSKPNQIPQNIEQFGIDTNDDGIIDINLRDNINRVFEQDGYSQLEITIDGNEQINLNDKILLSYSGVQNPSSSGNYSVNITANNEKTYEGRLLITPDTSPGTLGLCGTPQGDNARVTPTGSYTHRAVDVSGSQQDVYSAIKFSVTNQNNKKIQKINEFCIATSSEDASAIQYDSSRSVDSYGALLWFDGRNSNGYATTPPTLGLGNQTAFDKNGNLGRNTNHVMQSFEFVDDSGQAVDMRGETIQLRIIYQSAGNKNTDVLEFELSGTEDNNP